MISLTCYKDTPLLGFAAFSGTGKTTLLEQLLPKLNQAKLRIAMLKHTHHEKFDIDHPGKDSYRLRKAGAQQMLVASAKRWALMVETEPQLPDTDPDLKQLITHLDTSNCDLILVEGFKHEAISKIELHREELGKPFLYPNDPNIIAIASDEPHSLRPIEQANIQYPLLDINNIDEISQFIIGIMNEYPRKPVFKC